jgi:hypothetical protein
MNKYVRVMHPAEAEIVRETNILPTNREDWGEHKAGSVVFLFEADRVSWAYICARSEDIVESCGTAVILVFQGFLLCAADKSGWDLGGATVHNGPISVDNIVNLRWRQYTPFV